MQLLDINSVMLKPESVFYTVKQILLTEHKKLDPLKIQKGANFYKDFGFDQYDIIILIRKLEEHYNRAIPVSENAENATTLYEFCSICAKALNKNIPFVKTNDFVKTAVEIITKKYKIKEGVNVNKDTVLRNLKVAETSKTVPHKFDELDKLELIIELEKKYRIKIDDNAVSDEKYNTLQDFCDVCIKNSKPIVLINLNNLTLGKRR